MGTKGRVAGAVALVVTASLIAANWPIGSLPAGVRADSLVVRKGDRQLELYGGGRRLETYHVSLGRAPEGDKLQEGDRRTPEGLYRIDARLEASAFHRALHVSYPDSVDMADAKRHGVDPGGAIMVHGIRNGLGWLGRAHRLLDWTSGCIALTNPEIDQLWALVPDGTPIRIVP